MKKTRKGAFTLLELIVGIAVLIILCLVGFALIGQVSQKTKVAVAKAYITQYSMLLETIKGDANYYPPAVNNTLESLTYINAPSGYGQNWRGPYLKTTPVDPWGTPYFYRLVYGVIFGPQFLPRVAGPPSDETYYFDAIPSQATIIVNNDCKIINSGTVWLNGVEIVSPNEFQSNIPVIQKDVTITARNTLRIRLTSNPGSYILVSITSPFSNRAGYVLGSYGFDGEPGGTVFARDLKWESGQSGAEF